MRTFFVAGSKVLATAIVIAIVIALWVAGEINDEIDRCDDQSSGKYIWDDAMRAKECDR
jgi:hypothetical protein